MTNPKGLSVWVNSKIGTTDEYEFKSNRAFAKAFNITEPTVRRLRNNQQAEATTLEKLAAGMHMNLVDFLEYIEKFAKDEKAQSEVEAKLKGAVERLNPENQEAVWALVERMLKQQAE